MSKLKRRLPPPLIVVMFMPEPLMITSSVTLSVEPRLIVAVPSEKPMTSWSFSLKFDKLIASRSVKLVPV